MLTTIAFPKLRPSASRLTSRDRRAYTLIEILISTGLSGIVLAAVLSAVLMVNRSGFLLTNYIEMEQHARNALETFAVDSRMARAVEWGRTDDAAPLTSLTLINPDGTRVTYSYDAAAGTLTRTPQGGAPDVLVHGIQSFTFTAYRYNLTNGLETIVPSTKTLTALANETKMVQLSLASMRSRSSLADATNNVVSARFVLRNKIITN